MLGVRKNPYTHKIPINPISKVYPDLYISVNLILIVYINTEIDRLRYI